MEIENAVAILSALAHDSRLDVYGLLVQAGPGGLPAGRIAAQLSMPAATLSFHLGQLRHAGLVRYRRAGRSLIYAAEYDAMNGLIAYLTENCCEGSAGCNVACADAAASRPADAPCCGRSCRCSNAT